MCLSTLAYQHTTKWAALTYTWADFLELPQTEVIAALPLLDLIPERYLMKRIWRKRESRGQIRNWLQWMNSLHYCNTSMFCFTEMWLYKHITVRLLWSGYLENMEINWAWALHGLEWQMGNHLHSLWDCLLKALWNFDCVIQSSLSTLWVHTADCDSCLCPWPWQCTGSWTHICQLQQRCLQSRDYNSSCGHHTAPTAGAVCHNPNVTGQNAGPMLWKYTWRICL